MKFFGPDLTENIVGINVLVAIVFEIVAIGYLGYSVFWS